jgi:phosphoglycolate phosphatase
VRWLRSSVGAGGAAVRLVSLDLDGTLVDTAAEIAGAANRALAAHGLACRPAAEIGLLIGRGGHALMRALLAQDAGAAALDTEAVLRSYDQHIAELTGTASQPYPGAAEALALLRGHGVRLACVTNKELLQARRVLRAHRLEGAFELVLGGDSLPEQKPHASVLRYVADTMGVPREAVAHVGDSAVDVMTARNAGVAAWAVPYGYNAGEPIAAARPDRIFDTLLEMARHVTAGARTAA